MKVLITGVAGFIGSSAAIRFLEDGHQVVGLDNLSRLGNMNNLELLNHSGGCFRFHRADIRNLSGLEAIFAADGPFDLILHEAGQVAVTRSIECPAMDFEINALGTLNLLEVTRRASRDATLIYASTNKVYGGLTDLKVLEADTRYGYVPGFSGVSESQPIDFHSPYGCSKGCADQYVRDYARIYGLKTVVFRQSCIYGTRQFGVEDQGWVAWFAIAAALGRKVVVYGDGKQVRDILWIDDLLDLYCSAAERIDVAAGKIYNAGGGSPFSLSILELLHLLQNDHAKRMDVSFGPWRAGDQKIFVADCQAAARDLNWTPKVNPAEGIGRLIAWAEKERELLRSLLG